MSSSVAITTISRGPAWRSRRDIDARWSDWRGVIYKQTVGIR
jgi:hypothetical protein